MGPINPDLIANGSSIIAAVGVVVFGLQKAVKAWSVDRGDIQKIDIDSSLYQRLNAELERLDGLNKEYATEIKELRNQYSTLQEEFNDFKLEHATKDILISNMNRHVADCEQQMDKLIEENNFLKNTIKGLQNVG